MTGGLEVCTKCGKSQSYLALEAERDNLRAEVARLLLLIKTNLDGMRDGENERDALKVDCAKPFPKPAPETCSHCTGVLEKHQLEHCDGCLCRCHKPEKCRAVACMNSICQIYHPKPSPLPRWVEVKIQGIIDFVIRHGNLSLENQIRKLVQLVREERND